MQQLGLTAEQAEQRLAQFSSEEIQQLAAAPDSVQIVGNITDLTTVMIVVLVVVGVVAIVSIAS